MDIGHRLKLMRVRQSLTLEELASRSELTKGFLSQVERNLTSPSIATLTDILEALGSSLGEFFGEEKPELKDTVTVRLRDSMEQLRMPIAELEAYVEKAILL